MIAGGFAKQPRAVRFLFAVRWKLGAHLGWDKHKTSLGTRVQPLYDRLPGDLRETVDVSDTSGAPFTPVYLLHNESARELANKTCHAIMHLGWVRLAANTNCGWRSWSGPTAGSDGCTWLSLHRSAT